MRLAVIVLLLSLVGCSTMTPLRPLTAEQREAFVATGWQSAIPASEDAIIRKFGSVFSITREPQHNRHVEGQIDHWAELDSPNLKVNLYQMPDKELVTHVEVSDSGITFGNGVHAGMTSEQITILLGTPDLTKNGNLFYEAHAGMDASVTFHVTNKSVDRIVWDFEID